MDGKIMDFRTWLAESKYDLEDLKKFAKQAKVDISKFDIAGCNRQG